MRMLQAKTVFAMAVLLAVCGAIAFALCLWGSILGCMIGESCAPPQPAVFTVSCYSRLSFHAVMVMGIYKIISQNQIPNFVYFSGLHHYECVAPLVANSLQSGRFWARSTASVHDSPWESRSFCIVFIQVTRGRPGGLFQYTEGEEVKICFASTLSSVRAICPNRVRRRAWITSVS